MYNRGYDHPRILNIQCSFLSLEMGFGVQVTFQSSNNLPMAVLPTSTVIFCPNPQHDMLITDKKACALQHRSYSLTVGRDTNVLQTMWQGNICGEHKCVNTTFSLKKMWSSGAWPPPWTPRGLEVLRLSSTMDWQVCSWPALEAAIPSWCLHGKASPIFATFYQWQD